MTTFGERGALELLNANLDTISNELSTLVLGNDLPESGNVQCYTETKTEYAVAVGADALMYWNEFQQLQDSKFTPYLLESAITPSCATAVVPIYDAPDYSTDSVPMNMNFPTYGKNNPIADTCAATVTTATPPKFEFHYLRSQYFNKSVPNAEPVPLISTATAAHAAEQQQQQRYQRCGQGAYKKYGNYHHHNKHNNKQQKAEYLREEVDDDKFEIDLEKIGIPADGVERNPILRLFLRFRKLNHYLHDKFPYGILVADEPVDIRPIPYTMNAQYQVKYAARNCTIFICDKERILNANKLYDRQIYAECEKSLQAMRKLLAQFEVYKRVELEHKRGQFVTEEARAQAERLELLMKQLCDQIRECNLRVHVFNWAVETKFKTQGATTASANCQMDIHTSAIQSQFFFNQQSNNKRTVGDGDDNDNTQKTSPGNRREAIVEPMRYIGSY